MTRKHRASDSKYRVATRTPHYPTCYVCGERNTDLPKRAPQTLNGYYGTAEYKRTYTCPGKCTRTARGWAELAKAAREGRVASAFDSSPYIVMTTDGEVDLRETSGVVTLPDGRKMSVGALMDEIDADLEETETKP